MDYNVVYLLVLIDFTIFGSTHSSMTLTTNNPFVDELLLLTCRTDQPAKDGDVDFKKPGNHPAGACFKGDCFSSLGYIVAKFKTNLTTVLLVDNVNISSDEGIWKCIIMGETAQTNVKFQATTPKRIGQTDGAVSLLQVPYINVGICWIALVLARTYLVHL